MFKSILIKNSFIKRNLYIEFKDGLNVIIGKNGIGKSSVLEYLNYSLFGTIALRSSLKDFQNNFYVETIFTIKDIEYKIERTPKSALLYEKIDNKFIEIVKGTTPVNLKIKELLNYDYNVYMLVNFCKQHELLNLTNSTPAQLLSLIEFISGLSGSYKLEAELKQRKKEIAIEENALKLSVDIALKDLENIFETNEYFETLISEYDDPLKFLRTTSKSYLDKIEILNNRIHIINEQNDNLEEYKSKLINFKEYSNLNIEDYQNQLEDILKLESKKESLKKQISEIIFPKVQYTEKIISEQENIISTYNRYKAEQRIRQSLEKHKVECPNCNHTFYNTSNNIEFEFDSEPEVPLLTLKEIEEQKQWLTKKDIYEKLNNELTSLQNTFGSKENDKINIKKTIEGIQQYNNINNQINDLEFKLNTNSDFIDNSITKSLEILENLKEKNIKEYEELEILKTTFSEYLLKKLDFEKKEEVRNNFGSLSEQLIEKKRIYNILLEVLKEVKVDIQATTLPKLNFIASKLFSEVTCGERNKIEITEDFKLLVDNQNITTLEGSAQVLTNIALRCALLLTFYSDTFLVSIQDESDAALSEDRFEALIEAYKHLELNKFQLIIISHKTYNYGNIINLEDTFYNSN